MSEHNEIEILRYKIKFIEDIFSDKIIMKKKMSAIIEQLEELHYPKFGANSEKTYNYLLKIPFITLFSYETIAEYKNEIRELQIKNMLQKPEEIFIDI
jgi:hypothetical protein